MSVKAIVSTAIIGPRSIVVEGLSTVFKASRYCVRYRSETVLGFRADRHGSSVDLCVMVHLDSDIDPFLHNIAELRRDYPTLCIVTVSRELGSATRFDAAGADGHVPITVSPEAFLIGLDLLVADGVAQPLGRRAAATSNGDLHDQPVCERQVGKHLSPRELDVVERLAKGESNKHVASRLAITEATVKAHIRTILKKTGTSNRTQVALWARNTPQRVQNVSHFDRRESVPSPVLT